MDFSAVVCPVTGVTAGEAASSALIARDHLGGEVTADVGAPLRERRWAMIEDVRVLTGLLAAELSGPDVAAWPSAAARLARETHRATLRSDDFAFHAALAMRDLDATTRPD